MNNGRYKDLAPSKKNKEKRLKPSTMTHMRPGWAAIHLIAEMGNWDLLENKIKNEENLYQTTSDQKNILHISALNRHFPFVKRLLEVVPDIVKAKDMSGWTALHFAVAGGDIDIYQEVANRHVSPRIKDNDGVTCLHLAAKEGKIEIMKRMLDVCPEVLSMTTNIGKTAMHCAVEGGHTNVFEELVERRLDASKKDSHGDTCLHLATEKGNLKFVREILRLCPEVGNEYRSDGTTALHIAAFYGYVDIFSELVANGLQVDSCTETYGTCLHIASHQGHMEMVRHILENHKELINMVTSTDKWTALHQATAGGHCEIFQLLKDHGEDPTQLTAYRGSVFHIVATRGTLEMAKHIMKECLECVDIPRRDGWTPLHQCAEKGRIDIFEVFKGGSNSLEAQNQKGETCLHLAAYYGKCDMVKYILSISDKLSRVTTLDGNTALHQAAAGGSIETFDTLRNCGLSVTDKNDNEETCLYTAASHGRQSMVSHILEISPQLLNIVNKDHWSVLHVAAFNGHIDVYKTFINAGLLPSSKTSSGETAEDVARLNNQERVLRFIQEEGHSAEGETSTQIPTLDQDKIDIYISAVKGQTEKRRNIRLMVVGYEGVGKSTFCCRLMNKTLSKEHIKSTDGIDIYINRFLIDLEAKSGEFLENQNEKDINLNRLTDVLKTSIRTSQVFSKHDDSEVIYERARQYSSIYRHTETEPQCKLPKLSLEREETTKQTHTHGTKSKNNLSTDQKRYIRTVVSRVESEVRQQNTRKAYASLWDCGGHEEFYNSHHIFLSSDAVYVLTFNISKDLKLENERKKLKFWLQSIHAHSSNEKSKKRNPTPPIILIGTHYDLVQEKRNVSRKELEKEKMNTLHEDEEIKEILLKHFRGMFVINTPYEPQETFRDIWRCLIEAAEYQSQWEKDLPAWWLLLEREIMNKRTKGIKMIGMKEIEDLGRTLEIPMTDLNDIQMFLRYFNSTGEILHFPGRDKVVIDPQWIVHAFRRFITAPKFFHTGYNRYNMLWNEYQKSGRLGSELIELAWGRDVTDTFLDYRTDLLEIMERLGLIASQPQDQQEQTTDRDYFVPALLQEQDSRWLDPILRSPNTKRSCSICFVFQRCIPFTLLDMIQAFCIQEFEPVKIPEHNCKNWLQRGCACFEVDCSINMILCCENSVIKATLFQLGSTSNLYPGVGVGVCIKIENAINTVLELSRQQHTRYDTFLNMDYRIYPDEKRIPIKKVSDCPQGVPCWSIFDKTWYQLRREEYNIWFLKKVHPDEHVPLTDAELGRISTKLGAPCLSFYIGLGLSSETIDRIKYKNRYEDPRDGTFRLLQEWRDVSETATKKFLLDVMKEQGMPIDKIVPCFDRP